MRIRHFSLLSGCVTALSNRNGDHPPSYIPTNELMNQTRQNDIILQSKNLIQAQQQQPSTAQQTAAQQSIPLYRRQAGNTGSRPFNVMSEQNLQSNVQMPMKSTGTEHIDNNSLFEMFNHNGSHNEMSKKHSNLQHFQGLPPLQNLSETSNLQQQQQQAHNLYTNSNSSIITLNHIQQPHHSNEKPNKRSNDHDEHTRQTNSLTYASVLTQGASNQQQQNQKQQQTQKNEGDPFGSIRALGPLF